MNYTQPQRLVVCLGFIATLSACTVGPSYRRAAVEAPPAYIELAPNPDTRAPPADADLAAWWQRFSDPLLTDLIQRALASNLDLQTAVSRVRAARLQEVVARAGEYPSVSADADAITFNKKSAPPASSAADSSDFTLPSHLNLFAAALDASWEIDLFGGTRRAVEAARANSEAALWARRDGEVTLVAEVANDYLTLRMLQTRIAIGNAELARQKSLYELVAARRQAGFVTRLDVNQQGTVVESAAAQIPQLEQQAKVQTHAIAVLLGELPETLARELESTPAPIPPPPPGLPPGLPSELLQRRPDLREAERRVAAANAEIGVAQAARFPKLNLIGLASFASTSADELFSSRSFATAGVGMASAPLFDAGKLRASVEVAKEQELQATLAYRTAVLGAFRDVEDALARYHAEETRRQALARSVDAAQNSLTIAQDQYQTGFVAFINVLQAENALSNAQDQLTQSDAQVLTDLVALYKALGGGWSPSEGGAPQTVTGGDGPRGNPR
jgi:NodT family efflux transporter outer membrane factor (OMF) lipoprotein